MKETEDTPVVQRVREARRKLTQEAGGDFKTYLRNLRKYEEERLAKKSKFRIPARTRKTCSK